jgi:hypothetical protein
MIRESGEVQIAPSSQANWAPDIRFDEAMEAFRKAGRPDQSQRLVEQLTHNAGEWSSLLGLVSIPAITPE